jgi:hypothetical protein
MVSNAHLVRLDKWLQSMEEKTFRAGKKTALDLMNELQKLKWVTYDRAHISYTEVTMDYGKGDQTFFQVILSTVSDQILVQLVKKTTGGEMAFVFNDYVSFSDWDAFKNKYLRDPYVLLPNSSQIDASSIEQAKSQQSAPSVNELGSILLNFGWLFDGSFANVANRIRMNKVQGGNLCVLNIEFNGAIHIDITRKAILQTPAEWDAFANKYLFE